MGEAVMTGGVWPLSACESIGSAAAVVIGQENVASSGENPWRAVVADAGSRCVMPWQRGVG
jgi:hypothetical protein